jgi:lysyl-tRNA synthetase, class I
MSARPLASLRRTAFPWPFEEARKIVARLKRYFGEGMGKPKDEVIFETGYGPSGLPHIGTFGEVARTTMVRHAFRVLTDDKVKTRLICLLRRHGRPAQGAGQRAEQGDAGASISASR